MVDSETIIRVAGGVPLKGEVTVDGSKNSALACLVAACLAQDDDPVRLENIPDIADVRTMIEILRETGKTIDVTDKQITISGRTVCSTIPVPLSGAIRASTYCLGYLLAACGEVEIGLPGGDAIGDRPIDIHLEGLEQMGVQWSITDRTVKARCKSRLRGDTLFLRYPSVGATCNLMIAASLAEGRTVIQNAAKEPEIVDLANLISAMGARVVGAGSDNITIHGREKVHGGIVHEVIPDRIETGVLLTALAATGGAGVVHNCIPYHNHPLLSVLERAGVWLDIGENQIEVRAAEKLEGMHVTALPYPGLATDLQPFLAILALRSPHESTIADLVFPERFAYVYELMRMGALITHNGNTIRIIGGQPLTGCPISGGDIRSVTALVSAGLIAEGVTEIHGNHHLRRGYHDLPAKLRGIGARISVVSAAE